MKTIVSSFGGSWFRRCLSMLLCFCMVLSLCPIPQHAAASEAGEIQEVSQPVETQPAPQPVETQPAPQPVETQPAPQPVETQPAPQPEQTQPAPQPEETQPVTEPEQTQPVTVPEQTQPVTVPEETQPVTVPEETQEVTEPEETQEVTEPEETQEVTEPEETQETTEPEETQEVQPLVVTGWQWVDEEGYINPETNELLINFASAEQLVTAEDLLFVLPYEIVATVDGEAVQLPLGEWFCSEYPEEGAYQGEYVFKTSLPEGYVLAEDAAQLEITVVFESLGAALYADEPHAHSYVNGICSDETCTDPYDAPIQTDGVYQIANAGNLFWFANYCNESDGPRSARLLNSIAIPEKADGSKRDWTPIGTSSLPYTGTFDGQGFTISGLYFNDSSADYVGLFGCVKLATTTGTIQNVTVAGEFTGNQYVGGICGYLEKGAISGCTNNAAVSAVEFIGGICGASDGKISNCHNSGSIVGQKNNSTTRNVIGGICGASFGTIERCSNSGAVSAQSGLAGGITGSLSFEKASLKDCWNTGSVTGTNDVGGISGLISGCSITGCYSIGTVSGTSDTGPICGGNNGTLTNCYYQASSETDSFDGTTFKTADQFKSGEVAYLLNGDGNTLTWIQNLGTDSYPRLGSDQQYRVYKTDYCPTYSNDADNTNPHSAPKEGSTVCRVCGAQFVASVTVGDATSYYTTFQGASYAAVSLYNDSTVTLLADVATDYFPDINVIFNLNLNGKTLNVNNAKIYVYEYAVLNVQGTGTLNLQAGNKLHVEGGTVNIQGGAIDGDIQVCNSKEISGNLSISGGSLIGHIVATGSEVEISVGSVKGNITLNDGKYYADSSDEPWPLYSTLQISGGKFEGNIVDSSDYTTFDITGGEFVNLSYTGNKNLSELPAKDHWFYKTCSESNGKVTYSGLVPYSDLDTASYTGTLYVGPHDHSYTYTTITDKEHKGTCGCGKEDNGQHKFENGFCTSCDAYQKPEQDDSGVYQIANAGNLFWFAAKVNGGSRSISGKLTADITIPNGRTWTPIGNSSYDFAGKFDGNGKTISGLNINGSSMAGVGLFGYVGSVGRVFNLTVANSNFYGNNPVGGICGNNKGTITGCTSSANVSGTQNVGGICGNNASSGKITDCSNSGTVNGNGNTFVGGICGTNSGSVTNCFNIGTVPGKKGAGIYGFKNNNGTAVNCYYLAASETDNGDGTFGKTEAQFKSGEVAYLLNANRTPTVWGQTIGSQNYPVLNGEAVSRALKCDNVTVAYYINGTEDITLGHEAPGEDGNCPVCDALIVASVTGNGGDPVYYSDFFVACEAAYEIDGSKLTLLQDVDISIPGVSYSSYIDKRMTLDLNGKNLKLGSITFIIREDAGNYGNLTVTGDGMLSLNEPVTVNDGCTLTIEGGTIDAAIIVNDGGKVNITGGSFEKANGFGITNSDSISITGGEFIQNALSTSYYLKSLLGKDENGDYAYWYYQTRTETDSGYTYSDPITLADAEKTDNSVKLYVGSHEHAYVNDGTCVCGKMRPVKMSVDGEYVKYFDSLDAALEYLQSYPVTARGEITLRDDVSCDNLVIPEKVTLEVNSGVKLDAGAVYVRGSLKNNGTIMGHVYYLLELTNCTAQCTNDGIQSYGDSTYAEAGTEIELTPVTPEEKMFVGWQCAQATIEADSFKMPNKATSVTARIETIVATVTIGDVTTPYSNLYDAFDAANGTEDGGRDVIIELKADAKLDSGTIQLGNRFCNVIFRGGEYTISGNEPGDWENRNGYIGVLSGANLTIESGTIASSAFLYCGSGSSVTVTNGSIHTLVVEDGKLTVENASDEENNPVGNIQVENLEVMYFDDGDIQLKGGSYGSITVPEGNDVSDLLAEGYAYKLTDGSWEDANNGAYTEAISAATVLPVPVTIIAQPDATKTMTYGDVESLSVTANREEASYQWYEVIPDTSETAQAKAITGETGSTLKLSTFDAGTHEFFCEATVDGYNAKSSPATVTVNPRTLDIQWDGDTFEYDGKYHPKFTIGNTANGDQVIPVISPNNDTQKNVGNYTVGVVDFVANGTDGLNKHGNYKLGGTTYQNFSITAKPITVNITANGGTYGGAITGATAELVGVVAGETVPVTLTYTSDSGYNSTTAPTDAGTYTVTATIKNRNYQLTGTTTAEFVVNKATNSWTAEPSVSNWTYGDSSTVNPGEASFGTVQVTYYKGETKLTAAPTDAGSYKVIFTVEGTDNYKELTKELDFTINRRDLTIIGAKVYNNGRAYDGTKVVELESFTYSNVVTGDTVRVGFPDVGLQGTLNSADAGTYSQVTLPQNLLLTDNGDGSAKNYNLVMLTEPVATDVTISPKEVTFSGITAADKEYDATTDVTLDDSGLQITGLITGDDLSVSVTAAFADANAGQNKAVTFTNPTLTGEDSGNYVLAQSGNQTGTTATIEPLVISIENVTVEDKVYDGTTDATITSSGSLSKNLDGENLTIVPGTASFETAGAGNGKTVSFQGFDLGGSAQGNYQLSGQPASTTANIIPATVKQLTLKSTSATYDGNAKVPEVTKVTSKNDLTLTGSDYQVSYQDASGSTVTELKNAGEYTVTVIGTGNFQGTATADFTIEKAKPNVTTAALTITYGTKLSGCDLSGFKADFDGSVLPGSFAFDEPDTMPQVSDSDTTRYKLTFTPTDTVNFEKAPATVTVTVNKKELTVDVAVKDKQYNGLNDAEFSAAPKLIGLVSGDEDKVTLTNGTATFETVAVGQNISIIFTDFSISGDASGNYTLTQPTGITASIYNTFTAVKGENGNYTVSTNEWTKQDFVVTGLNGSKLSLTNTADGTWSDTLPVTTEGEGDLSFYVRSSDGAISKQATEHYKLDKTAPTGTIRFDGKNETESSPTACYKNQDVAVTLTGRDALSGVASVSYIRSSTEQTEAALKDVTDWTEEAGFTVEVEDKAVCYVYSKVVDNAGNVAYFRANWIVFDTTAPVITGVENGATYYTTQTAAVSDDYLDAVTLNEEAKTSPVKLTGDVDATYIIKATDKAGNETTVTVTMKPISSITEPFKDLTTDNVTEEDRKDLEDADELLSELLDTATDENEKQKLQEELDKLKELLDVLDNAKDVEEILKNLPDSVEPDADDDTVKAIEDARKALDELTDHEEDLVDDKLIEKLERLEDELVDYKFLEAISVWNLGSGIDASFVANGRLDKLEKVLLNENELTTGFTKDTPRTTIVLKAALLQSLELGEYTLKLVYTNGSTETTFSVKQSINYLDLTDESDFDDQTEVDIGGKSYPIEELGGKRYVNLPESGELLTTYTYLSGTDAGTHENYPIGMRVFRIHRSEDGTTVEEITEFIDLLQYSGCSIRVSGKRGIRMITSMTKSNKAALKGKGLAGFTMLEYGTVVQWADSLGADLTLDTGNHNYAYKRGVADPVFGTSGDKTQYTNVLVGFDLEECSKDIVMRPYIILQDAEGNQYTLYGGLVTRSISYIAWQNRDTYKSGTAAYKYVHELMGDLDTPAEGG